ncbi:Hypothetical protein R9X50_00685800 [Acrodontium crateriforme]|uniref:CAP-Gly domain-containing protein n=1 Tax=Acrodontium crateriforme TaxID=150365 RepID=A0AAQ3RCE4_9PEZI|nr:Hypothetical protein R9X50_00685800 [Acrodontium crateriforme]
MVNPPGPTSPSVRVGQRIELNDGRIATVRFVGPTSFQTGEWVGVELGDATGKNDGSVQGERYFECEHGYGMFLRQAGVKRVIPETGHKTRGSTASNGVPAARTRPASIQIGPNGLKRQSIVPDGHARKPSGLGGAAALGGARPGSATAHKSPARQASNTALSSATTSRTVTPSAGKRVVTTTAPATARSRMSMPPPPTTTAAKRTSSLFGGTGTPTPTARGVRTATAMSTSTTSARTASRDLSGRVPPGRITAAARPELRRRAETPSEGGAEEEAGDRSDVLSPGNEYSSLIRRLRETEEDLNDEEETAKPNFAPPPPPPIPTESSDQAGRRRRPSSPTSALSIHSQRTMRSTAASTRQIEELEAKIRLLERKRQEDRDIKKNLEQSQQERDQYKGIIDKLQNKYRPQQQEIATLKRELAEAEKRSSDVAAMQAEHESIMELATIDREMAEEKAQSLEEQLESLRLKHEELQLEAEILREENEELSKEMSPEERTSAGWMQMEKSNERLREALLRLRDITQDKEAELREKIESMESQIKESESMRAELDDAKEKLLRAEADVEDLRQQLEVAEESEAMIEQLAEQKSNLEERIHHLRNTIEELEELKELNDELVINHQEDEKQMQEEIDFKDSLLLDRERTARQQQDALDEADSTIAKYRTLVSELHSSLQEMHASKQFSENEAADLNSKSRAMLDLNMKLQSSAAKAQVKTIDLELRKLEAQEASEHLAIVQLFLPDAFESEKDSVLALLRFKRVSFKSNLVHGFLKERVASFGTRGEDEDIFAACAALDSLTWIAAMSDCFTNSICGCSVDEFATYASALYELEPIERALNNYIDGLRREELHEKEMAEELQRSIAVMTHLSSLHISGDLASHADHLLMRTQCLQSQLETTASALGLIRSLIENNVRVTVAEGEDEDDDGRASDLAFVLNRAETLISTVRSAKVTAGKTHRSLTDLESRSLTLESNCTESFDSVDAIVEQVARYAREAGEGLQTLFGEEGRVDAFVPSEVTSTLSRVAMAVFALPVPEAGPFSTLTTWLKDLSDLLVVLSSLPTDLDNTIEFERAPAPWVARANELKQSKITSLDIESQLSRALDNIKDRDALVKDKETELEEQAVRIEMLEARMKDASKRSARIAELERALHAANDGAKNARAELKLVKQHAAATEDKIRAEMMHIAEANKSLSSGSGTGLEADAMGAGTRANLDILGTKVKTLEGAVRFLHEENHRLRLPAPHAPIAARNALEWLREPLRKEVKTSKHASLIEDQQILAKTHLLDLIHLASRGPIVDLGNLPANKLAWRPAKVTPRWQVERCKEEWETWREKTRDAVRFLENESGRRRGRGMGMVVAV